MLNGLQHSFGMEKSFKMIIWKLHDKHHLHQRQKSSFLHLHQIWDSILSLHSLILLVLNTGSNFFKTSDSDCLLMELELPMPFCIHTCYFIQAQNDISQWILAVKHSHSSSRILIGHEAKSLDQRESILKHLASIYKHYSITYLQVTSSPISI